MATVTEPLIHAPTAEHDELPYSLTSDVFAQMVEAGLIPQDKRVYLWDGRLFEKMAKTLAHVKVHSAINMALARRLPRDFFVGSENPVRLDNTHLPLPDLTVVRGMPLDLTQYPDGRNVVLVLEVAVTSLREDLGIRLSRYALALPDAIYIVADVSHHRVLVHLKPGIDPTTGQGIYAERLVIESGGSLRLKLGEFDIEPIPFEEIMR